MVRLLPYCNGPVVTTGTDAQHLSMIHRIGDDRRERCGTRPMTGITAIRRINMARLFTRGNTAVVTTGTTAIDLTMIYRAS